MGIQRAGVLGHHVDRQNNDHRRQDAGGQDGKEDAAVFQDRSLAAKQQRSQKKKSPNCRSMRRFAKKREKKTRRLQRTA